MATLIIMVREIPASPTHPFRIRVNDVLVFEDTKGNTIKQVRVTIPDKETAQLRVTVAEHNLDEVRNFDLAYGKNFAIFSEEGRGLFIVQRSTLHRGDWKQLINVVRNMDVPPSNGKGAEKSKTDDLNELDQLV